MTLLEQLQQAQEHLRALEERAQKLEAESQEKDRVLQELRLLVGAASKAEATPAAFTSIFEEINLAISKDEVLAKAKVAADEAEATAPAEVKVNADYITRLRVRAADAAVTQTVESVWASHGWKSDDAMRQTESLLQGELGGDEESLNALEEAFTAFTEVEERNVLVAAMGEEKYRRQQQDKAEMQQAMQEAQEALMSADVPARKAFVEETNRLAQVVIQTKLSVAKNMAEMDEILGGLPPNERQAMFRAQAIAQLLGVNRGGHSHNGQPCHGHGHEQQTHTHSHNGKPCGGHGHSHGAEDDEDLEEGEYVDEHDHGHSHDHHGHSHDHHGHSHDHHGHSHDHHGHSHDQHGHSH